MIGGHIYGDRTTLIRGGYVLTLDPALGDQPNADVLIDGDKIAAVGPGLTAGPHANVIDARNRIVMPGFVDTHRHTWQTPVRGVLPSCTLDEYFAACWTISAFSIGPKTFTSPISWSARGD
jgi:cytosine/adenosine deaminase-related metal-dependent hydrolase